MCHFHACRVVQLVFMVAAFAVMADLSSQLNAYGDTLYEKEYYLLVVRE